MKTLLIIAGVLLYLASPIDLIPDIAPIIGWLDDVGILAWGANTIFSKPAMKAVGANDDAIEVS